MHGSEAARDMPGIAVRDALATLFLTTFPQTALSLLNMAPPVMAKALTASLGLAPEAAGLYIGVVYVCAMLSNMRAAALIARFGPLRLSFACVVIGGIGMALFAFGTLPAALAATLLIGLGYGPLTSASSQVLARHGPPRALGLFLSVRQTSVPLGGLLAGAIVPSASLALGWAGASAALGLGIAALALAVALAFPAVRREEPAGPVADRVHALDSLRLVLASPSLRGLAFGSLAFSAMQVILTSFPWSI